MIELSEFDCRFGWCAISFGPRFKNAAFRFPMALPFSLLKTSPFLNKDVTALAFQSNCTNHKCRRDRLDSNQFNGSSQLRQFVYFQSCFENVHMR